MERGLFLSWIEASPMLFANQTAVIGQALAVGVAAVAALLGVWLWLERRHREEGLSEADIVHFARQDRRRRLVVLVLFLLAIGLAVGSRLPAKGADAKLSHDFVLTWLGVIVLVLALLVLAFLDWLSTRIYAKRHFRALTRERIEILRDELKRRSSRDERRNGTGDARFPSLDPDGG